jgi:hypothetical protein
MNFNPTKIKDQRSSRASITNHSLDANVASVIKLNQKITILNQRAIFGRKSVMFLERNNQHVTIKTALIVRGNTDVLKVFTW